MSNNRIIPLADLVAAGACTTYGLDVWRKLDGGEHEGVLTEEKVLRMRKEFPRAYLWMVRHGFADRIIRKPRVEKTTDGVTDTYRVSDDATGEDLHACSFPAGTPSHQVDIALSSNDWNSVAAPAEHIEAPRATLSALMAEPEPGAPLPNDIHGRIVRNVTGEAPNYFSADAYSVSDPDSRRVLFYSIRKPGTHLVDVYAKINGQRP
jgi:hypothetical protein